MATLPSNVSESVRRLNPHLFGLGGLQSPQPQQSAQGTLERPKPGGKAVRKRVARSNRVIARVHIVSFRSKDLDRDNLVGGCKWIRDAIAMSLGIDDSERGIDWTYSQHITRGREGCVVTMEII